MAKIKLNREIYAEVMIKKKLHRNYSLIEDVFCIKGKEVHITQYAIDTMNVAYNDYIACIEKLYGIEYLQDLISESDKMKSDINFETKAHILSLDKVIFVDMTNKERAQTIMYDTQYCINELCLYTRDVQSKESFEYCTDTSNGFIIDWAPANFIYNKSDSSARRFVSPILFLNPKNIDVTTIYHEITHMLDAMLTGKLISSSFDRDSEESALSILQTKYKLRNSSAELIAYTTMQLPIIVKRRRRKNLKRYVKMCLENLIVSITPEQYVEYDVYKLHKNIKFKGRR